MTHLVKNNSKENNPISFRMPKDRKLAFYRKHPDRGSRSKVLNKIVQLYLDGKVQWQGQQG